MNRHEIVTLSVAVQSAWKTVTRLSWEINPNEFAHLPNLWLHEWESAGADYDEHARGILDRVAAIVRQARDCRVNDDYDAVSTCQRLAWTLQGVLDVLDALRTAKGGGE